MISKPDEWREERQPQTTFPGLSSHCAVESLRHMGGVGTFSVSCLPVAATDYCVTVGICMRRVIFLFSVAQAAAQASCLVLAG